MGKLAEAYVDVVPNLQPLDAGLNQAEGKLQGFVGKGTGILSGLAIGGTAVASLTALSAGLLDAAKKASDLGETLSKVQVTFGPAAKGMIKQAEELAEKYGVVRKESLDAAASFGLMGRAAGMSKNAAAELGNEFVKIGLDAASYFNTTNQEAFEKIRSGLAGEAEPLRAFGVLLSDDAMKAEALALKLTSVKRELTEQEKVIARASLIRKGLSVSSGDLERTSDSPANQLRKLEGQIEEAKTAFGEKLIPALKEGIAAVHELAESFEKAFGTGPVDAFAASLTTAFGTIRQINQEMSKGTTYGKALGLMLPGGLGNLMPSREDFERFSGLRRPGELSEREKAAQQAKGGIPGIEDVAPAFTFAEKHKMGLQAAKEQEEARQQAKAKFKATMAAQRESDYSSVDAVRQQLSAGRPGFASHAEIQEEARRRGDVGLYQASRREQARDVGGRLRNLGGLALGMFAASPSERLRVGADMVHAPAIANLVENAIGATGLFHKPRQFGQAAILNDASEYSRMAQVGILEKPIEKEQLNELKLANDHLQAMQAGIQALGDALARSTGGVFPRASR